MRVKLALLAISFFSSVIVSGQFATINPDSSKILKKGLYKNYEEFLNNNPSNTKDDFFVSFYFLNKKDPSSIVGANYQFTDSSKEKENVWGFCDGNAIYVAATPFSTQYYWKLIGLGKYPFFLGKNRSFMSLNFNELTLLIITEKGKFKEVDIGYMKKILAAQPSLLADFRKVADRYEQYDNPNVDVFESEETFKEKTMIMIEYLIKLNKLSQ
ncbi:MAG: hypothetical protein QM726_18710 [Chitinophagaceae bacterium]